MKTFRPYDPKQALLLPPDMQDWLPENHLARFVSDVLDEMDLVEITKAYEKEERGYPPYHPAMLTKVLVYGYCVGIRSSRRISRAMVEDVAFRVLAAGNEPDFRTIAEFRRRHLMALGRLFRQVLALCKEAGLAKVGHVAIDSTKVKANASKHKAMSYGRMKAEEERLAKMVGEMMGEAERLDREEDERFGKDRRGDELPEALSRASTRLAKIREAKRALEEKARAAGKEAPAAKAQRNFTDPDSGIMVNGERAFVQGYNCQAAVDAGSQVIVAAGVSGVSPDAPHLIPMAAEVRKNIGRNPKEVSADAGYWSEVNVKALAKRGILPFIAPVRMRRTDRIAAPVGRIPGGLTAKERMRRFLSTKRGRRGYDRRKETAEPVFGQIKEGRGFRQFLLRGIEKVREEWNLVCLGHNLKKLHRHHLIGAAPA